MPSFGLTSLKLVPEMGTAPKMRISSTVSRVGVGPNTTRTCAVRTALCSTKSLLVPPLALTTFACVTYCVPSNVCTW